MKNKIYENMLGPYLKFTVPIVVILCIVIMYFNMHLGLLLLGAVLILLLGYMFFIGRQINLSELYAQELIESLDNTLTHSIISNSLPICTIDKTGKVIMINEPFKAIYPDVTILSTEFSELTGIKTTDFFAEITLEKSIMITKDEKTYKVLTTYADGDENNNAVFYWIEVTNYEKLKVIYRDERTCFAYVYIDNFDELLANIAVEKRSEVLVQVEKILRQWASKMSASITAYKEGQYIVVFESKYYTLLESTKFPILDDIRGIETEADFPVSISIGVGMGGKTPAQQEEYAATALDLALGRGGDQAVIKRKTEIEFYGGRLQTIEKRNKGKSRIVAHALRRLIDQSSNVIIMGHKRPDMDCFGAAIGVSKLAKNRNRDVYIIMDPKNENLVEMYHQAVESGNYKFIPEERALQIIDRETLLIVVDTHRPSLVESLELLKKADKLVVIDHHRKAQEYIENAILTYMEAYASSTCELISEILQYTGGKKEIDKFEAEALLAGIVVDTNRFSIKTGVRTFEAASWLRRMGADTQAVAKAFQTEIETIRARAEIVSSVEILDNGIAVSKCLTKMQDIQVINSQAAEEILNIKGVKGCFVMGETLIGTTVISARSLGEVNVQRMMEKLGGGGNLSKAGAQVEAPVDETMDRLIELIKEEEKLNDSNIKKRC